MRLVADNDLGSARDEEAAYWCMRFADGDLSDDERRAFDAWSEDVSNAAALRDAIEVWQAADEAAEWPELIGARSQALDSFRKRNRYRWRSEAASRWRWPAALIASIVLALLTGLFLVQVPIQIYETGTGERRVAVLEDGSTISLDAATRVEVTLSEGRRELSLVSGRAKFDVAEDPLRPFSVRVGNKIVIATGTSFSVELFKDHTRVVLYEGSVDVLEQSLKGATPKRLTIKTEAGDASTVSLQPGRELIASLNNDAARVAIIDLQKSRSWEGGRISFDNEPLGTAIERMNRYSNTKLKVSQSAASSIRVSGVFDAGNNDAFLEGIMALNPELRRTSLDQTAIEIE